MKKNKSMSVLLVLLLCFSVFVTSCGGDNSESDVTSIRLTKYNDTAISGSKISVDFSVGTLTFTADVQGSGKGYKEFTLESSSPEVASASDKTVTLVSAGETRITAIASADETKKHFIMLTVVDTNPYTITVIGGTADKETALSGQTVTLTANAPDAGKVFTDWTIEPAAAVMTSATQFRMTSANVTATANFEDTAIAGAAPYSITNNFAQDSSTAFLVQWHNGTGLSTQTLQIVAASGSFSDARNISVTGENWVSTGQTGTFAARNLFRVEVDNLKPATFYKYRVGTEGAWSKTFYHRTSGGHIKDFSFTVAADPQAAEHGAMVTTLKAANTYDPDNRFFLICGDIVNQIGDRPAEIVSYTNAANEINVERPIAATQGNHDTYYTGGGDTYIFGSAKIFNAFVTFPENGWNQGVHHGPDRSKSYYFYYNDVLVIMLNTMATSNATGTNEPNHNLQAAWLKEVLEKDRTQGWSKYKIIATHVPVFTGRSDERWLTPAVRAAYSKICSDYGVDIFFGGHDHVYLRSHPILITGTNTALSAIDFGPTPGGTIYSIAGATGPKFYGLDNAPYASQFPVRINGETNLTPGNFVNIKVTNDKLTVTVMRVGSTTPVDSYTVPAK